MGVGRSLLNPAKEKRRPVLILESDQTGPILFLRSAGLGKVRRAGGRPYSDGSKYSFNLKRMLVTALN